MSYIGNPPVNGVFRKLDTIAASFNGSTTSFNLTSGGAPVIPGLTTNLIISLGGIIQEPNTAYTVNGSVISFTAAPPAGTSFWGIQLGDVGLAQTPNQNAMTTQVYTATAGQTTFTVNGGYTPGQLEVFRNGVMLVGGVDYTATNSTTFVLTNAATVGDTLVSVAYVSFIVANAVAKSGDTMTGNLNITGGTLQVGGNQAVNGPAFRAYRSATQTGVVSGTFTKVQMNIEDFDTTNCYDPTTNYRFTPVVPGYYQASWIVLIAGTGLYATASLLYKNGSLYCYGNYADSPVGSVISDGSTLVYMNGSTDYLEVYGVGTVTSGTITFGSGVNSPQFVQFSASMIRGA
jgi:hypothetical protein